MKVILFMLFWKFWNLKKHKKKKIFNNINFWFGFHMCKGVTDTSARQSDVWICVHKQLHVKHVAHFLWVENEDPLKEDYICWVNCDPLFLPINTINEVRTEDFIFL